MLRLGACAENIFTIFSYAAFTRRDWAPPSFPRPDWFPAARQPAGIEMNPRFRTHRISSLTAPLLRRRPGTNKQVNKQERR